MMQDMISKSATMIVRTVGMTYVGIDTKVRLMKMASSLKTKLKRLNQTCVLGNEDYKEVIDKLEGHDKYVSNCAVDSYVEFCLAEHRRTKEPINLRKLAESWKEQKNE